MLKKDLKNSLFYYNSVQSERGYTFKIQWFDIYQTENCNSVENNNRLHGMKKRNLKRKIKTILKAKIAIKLKTMLKPADDKDAVKIKLKEYVPDISVTLNKSQSLIHSSSVHSFIRLCFQIDRIKLLFLKISQKKIVLFPGLKFHWIFTSIYTFDVINFFSDFCVSAMMYLPQVGESCSLGPFFSFHFFFGK